MNFFLIEEMWMKLILKMDKIMLDVNLIKIEIFLVIIGDLVNFKN